MPSGVTTATGGFIIRGPWAESSGACMTITEDAATISVIADWPTCFRLPKFGLAYFLNTVPAGSYTPAGKTHTRYSSNAYRMPDASDTLQVYGNVDEVELFAQRQSLARRTGQWPFNLRICFLGSRRRKCRAYQLSSFHSSE